MCMPFCLCGGQRLSSCIFLNHPPSYMGKVFHLISELVESASPASWLASWTRAEVTGGLPCWNDKQVMGFELLS